jgi:hypothetical protein
MEACWLQEDSNHTGQLLLINEGLDEKAKE